MKKYLYLFSFLLVSMNLLAQTIVWNGKEDNLNIADKLSWLEDPAGKLTFEQVSTDSFIHKFTPSQKLILNFGFTESFYWLKFSFDNPTGSDLVLEIAHAFLPITQLYYRNDSGGVVRMDAGYKIPLNEKNVKHHFQIFNLPGGKHEYFVRVLSNSHPLPVRICNASTYEVKTYRQRLVFGFYLGFMCFVLLINLFFFFSLRNRMYLFYAIVVFIYVCYAALVMDGFILYFFPTVDLMFWYVTIPTIGVTVQMIYCLLFLEVGKYLPRLNRFGWGIVAYFTLYMLTRSFFPLITVLAVNTVNALISFFMMGYIGVKVGKKGNKLGYYFALAYFIYFILVLTEATYIQTGSPAYFAELSFVAFATLIEAFLLSFLLSKRFEWEKQDIERARVEATERLLVATLEKEKLVSEQNIVLEETVAKRTEQLNQTLRTVEAEREKSDQLLLNILPEETARELKENGFAAPKTHARVSVMFTDFVNFTKLSEKLTPEELVKNLNQCYSEFDRIVKKYQLEKIKTIGDAYMAVGGLAVTSNKHYENVVSAAIEILEFITQWNLTQQKNGKEGWELRIGIHSGPVVSGVVGTHKFSYDIWGDTVNTASRMEDASTPGKINISGTTYEHVKVKFNCIPRGKIEAKGKGDMEMYFVERMSRSTFSQ